MIPKLAITVITVILLLHSTPCAAVNSSSGNLSFDVNADGNSEATLNTYGLSLGHSEGSQALSVAGNAIVTDALAIGTSMSSANLTLAGSMAISPVTVSDNAELLQNSLVLADSSSGNIYLLLPLASQSSGRILWIKRSSSSNDVYLTSNDMIESSNSWLMKYTNGELPLLELISDGSKWHILSSMGNVSNVTLVDLSTVDIRAWYQLNETASGNAADNSVNNFGGLHLGFDAGEVGITGVSGNALSFDGNDSVQLPNIGNMSTVTVSAWIFIGAAQTGKRSILGHDQTTGGYYHRRWQFGITTDRYLKSITFRDNSNFITVQGSTQMAKGAWYHVAFTWDSSTVRLYINGRLDGSDVFAGPLNNELAGSFPYIGRAKTSSPEFWIGSIDDVRIYDRALSSVEINIIYSSMP